MGMVPKALLNEIMMMVMNDDTKDPLGNYERKPYPSLEKKEALPQLVKEQTDYKAFETFASRKSVRFRIIDENGKSYGCSYAHLLDWVCEPPTLLTLTTATRIFTFKGKQLHLIEKALMEDKVKEIHVFNPDQHKPVVGNKPIIEELTIIED